MMNYNVIAHYDDANVTCETNDIHVALTFLLEHGNTHIEVINGFTGEILYAQNCADPILEDAFGLTLSGFMMEQALGAVNDTLDSMLNTSHKLNEALDAQLESSTHLREALERML